MKVIFFTLIAYCSLLVNASFWTNVKRTELYEMMEKSIPEMHVVISNNDWSEMQRKAQITSQHQNSGFKVDAKLIFKYNGSDDEEYDIEFKLGGKSSTEFSKPGFNIKIKNGETLHGTKNFRLRSDQRDASMMRSKISTDILQKSGLIAVEVGYTELYINNEYRGFWVVSDSVKNKWIKRKFGDVDDITDLIQCRDDKIRFDDNSAKKKCVNANDEYADNMTNFNKFVDSVNAAKTRADLEKIMDVDNFIKYLAWEWLVFGWDHFLGVYGHNLYWYLQPNGKWVYIPYDHDLEVGQDIWTQSFPGKDFYNGNDIEFANISFKDFELNHPIVKILVHNDDTIFRECVGDIISKVFNPDTLLSHIDNIKNLISPYVKKDRDSGAGKLNKLGKDVDYTYEHFLQNVEYTYLFSYKGSVRGYGLKDWIRRRYNYAAAYYGIDKNHKLINPRPTPKNISYNLNPPLNWKGSYPNVIELYNPIQLPAYTPNLNYEDNSIPIIGVNVDAAFSPGSSSSSSSNSSTKTSTNDKTPDSSSCWSEEQGYQCCSGCDIVYEDNTGFWGVENNEWCGINSSCTSNAVEDECFSLVLGFPCCSSCDSIYEDDDGKWGVENNNWCGIKNSC